MIWGRVANIGDVVQNMLPKKWQRNLIMVGLSQKISPGGWSKKIVGGGSLYPG